MSVQKQSHKTLYFSTRDLLIMAVLAALGGVTSTYINTISDAVHAALGFPGASQWAAGLHVIWIVLAMGILRKPGTGTVMGILKGVIELMSGNSHGVIILLVDLVAGILVDFGFLLFTKKRNLFPYLLAGGLATGSNVLVFQLFATIPTNILGISAILLFFSVAFASGLIFAGVVPYLLVNSLAKAGVVKTHPQPAQSRKIGWYILLGVTIAATLLAVIMRVNYQGPDSIQITGAVNTPYEFPNREFTIEKESRQMEDKGMMVEYSGYPMTEIIDFAEPVEGANTLLIEASDGYAFLISFDELESNPNILIVEQGKGDNASYDVVGPESTKAWVRNVTRLNVIAAKGLTITTLQGEKIEFDPNEWVSHMDSTQIALPDGSRKLQGVPLWKVLEPTISATEPTLIVFDSKEDTLELDWTEIEGNNDLRIFTVVEEDGISFALAEMSGEVKLFPLTEIEIE